MPKGDKLAFSSNRSGKEEVYIADADGSNPRQITRLPEGSGQIGSVWQLFTPDDRSLVYWGHGGGWFMYDHHHYVLDLETGEAVKLPKRILSMAYPASLGGDAPVRIYVMDLDGGDHKTIRPPGE